ncbi:MAG: hypothetical protein WC955_10920 [Elusimicrobiota bacterium]
MKTYRGNVLGYLFVQILILGIILTTPFIQVLISENLPRAELYFKAGMNEYLRGNYTAAVDNLSKSLSYTPGNGKVKELLVKVVLEGGTQYYMKHDNTAALSLLEKGRKIVIGHKDIEELYSIVNPLVKKDKAASLITNTDEKEVVENRKQDVAKNNATAARLQGSSHVVNVSTPNKSVVQLKSGEKVKVNERLRPKYTPSKSNKSINNESIPVQLQNFISKASGNTGTNKESTGFVDKKTFYACISLILIIMVSGIYACYKIVCGVQEEKNEVLKKIFEDKIKELNERIPHLEFNTKLVEDKNLRLAEQLNRIEIQVRGIINDNNKLENMLHRTGLELEYLKKDVNKANNRNDNAVEPKIVQVDLKQQMQEAVQYSDSGGNDSLLKSYHQRMRVAAIALYKADKPRALADLNELMLSTEPEVVLNTVDVLIEIADDDTVEILMKSVEQKDYRIQSKILHGLVQIMSSPFVSDECKVRVNRMLEDKRSGGWVW